MLVYSVYRHLRDWWFPEWSHSLSLQKLIRVDEGRGLDGEKRIEVVVGRFAACILTFLHS